MAKSPKLRAYQRTAIESARRALTKSGSCILQMPTGAGKTRAATEIVATSRGVIWFVCHRQEIERQAAKAFTAAGIDFGVVSPRGEPEYKKRIQIVSVGTLARRLKELPEPKLVIWDECHHAPAKSWARLRAKLKNARHLGLTATPERLDGKGLGEWFAQLVTGPGITKLIKKGFLSEFKYYAPSDPDLTKAKMQAGDYKKSDLGKIMNTPVLIGDAVREYKKHAKGKRALAFCASVEASQALAAKFNAERITARHVDADTPPDKRNAAVQDLATGKIKVLCNVEVFTEGFDLPAIDAVILMRPTKSPTLLLQMIGRGLRKAKGKDVAIIMDHAGLHRDHAWFADDWHWSLDGGAAKARRKAVTRGPRRCPECKEVRAERIEVCSCGYEFPTGREIGEFDGVLTEVSGVVPDGCETVARFARRSGYSEAGVSDLVRRGMPTCGGYIKITAAESWIELNCRARPNDENVYKETFAKIVGRSGPYIDRLIKAGLPIDRGLINVDAGLQWIQQNVGNPTPPHGHETLSDFSRRINPSDNKCLAGRYKKVGLPMLGRFVNIDRGMEWYTYWSANKCPPNTMNMAQFARLLGKAKGTVKKMTEDGMPINGKYIPIQAGLEWVRDNRPDIKIPASAWPKYAKVKRKQQPQHELSAAL